MVLLMGWMRRQAHGRAPPVITGMTAARKDCGRGCLNQQDGGAMVQKCFSDAGRRLRDQAIGELLLS